MAFALFNLYWSRGSQLVASAQTDSFGRLDTLRHALTLICPAILSRLSPGPYHRDRVFVCACTHYLVFKEPTCRSALGASPLEDPSVSLKPFFVRGTYRVYYLDSCLSSSFCFDFKLSFRSPATHSVHRNRLSGNAVGLTWQYFRATVSSRHQGCLCPFTSDSETVFPSQRRSRRRLGNLTRLLSSLSLVNTILRLFENFLRGSSLAQGAAGNADFQALGNAVWTNLAVFSLGLSSLHSCQRTLCCPAAGVSRRMFRESDVQKPRRQPLR